MRLVRLLHTQIGVPPSTADNQEIWKDAILFNSYVSHLLDLFLVLYNHILFVMEREEFIKQKNPLETKDLVPLIEILKSLFFYILANEKSEMDGNLIANMRKFMSLCQ